MHINDIESEYAGWSGISFLLAVIPTPSVALQNDMKYNIYLVFPQIRSPQKLMYNSRKLIPVLLYADISGPSYT